MFKVLIILCLEFTLPSLLIAQVFPKEGSILNYRLVGFSFPGDKVHSTHTLEIAYGYYHSVDSFKKNIVKTITTQAKKSIVEVPAFGQEYTWRFQQDTNARLYHFRTGKVPGIDTSLMRLRIVQEAETYKDAYVFLDNNRVLYNMKGDPVWYLPPVSGKVDTYSEIRDIKLSPAGTITFINSELAYEINWNGDILWEGNYKGKVNADKSEFYHHELTRLSNGHYMVLGNEFVQIGNTAKMIRYGTVIEYDKQGNVVWSWKTSNYFKHKNFTYRIWPNGRQENTMHQNSFYFDEKKKVVYVSYKNTNQIVKIKYPEGNILNVYGKPYTPEDETNDLFCDQHSCKLTSKGYLMLFNNNMCNWNSTPKLVMFQELAGKNNMLKKVWEYETPGEVTTAQETSKDPYYTSGGNVIELPDQSLFVSMSNHYVNIFIVSLEKKIRWNAIPEVRTEGAKTWRPISSYRASIITGTQQIEKLIWAGQGK